MPLDEAKVMVLSVREGSLASGHLQLPLDSSLEALGTSWWQLVPLGKALASQVMPD